MSDCLLWGILHMSNGINQNATSYTTASVQEEGLLALCSGHCSAWAGHSPTAVPEHPTAQGCRARTSLAHARDSCTGLVAVSWGGLSVPFPSSQVFSRHEEQNGFLGATTSPVPLSRLITGNMSCCNPLEWPAVQQECVSW